MCTRVIILIVYLTHVVFVGSSTTSQIYTFIYGLIICYHHCHHHSSSFICSNHVSMHATQFLSYRVVVLYRVVCILFFTNNLLLFTARRYAKRGICRRRVSVCLSVCVSVTLRYCIKTAKRRITQITPYDSPGTLVF